ncbi:hypothetical protein NAI67_11480, partial [Francisella tularensis subsp. holarctica]|uniref:hypothetical protein n=1 Tax=Francisella tularensis TaxID=263 RepID=UPI002381A19F
KLIKEVVFDDDHFARMNGNYRSKLDNGKVTIDVLDIKIVKDKLNVCDWLPYLGKQESDYNYMPIPEKTLKELSLKISEVPA